MSGARARVGWHCNWDCNTATHVSYRSPVFACVKLSLFILDYNMCILASISEARALSGWKRGRNTSDIRISWHFVTFEMESMTELIHLFAIWYKITLRQCFEFSLKLPDRSSNFQSQPLYLLYMFIGRSKQCKSLCLSKCWFFF